MNPWLVAHVVSPLLERVLRRRTFSIYNQMMETQWWPAERLGRLQLAKLRQLLAMALTRTAAYARLAGLDRSWRPESLADLARLPLLDKAILSTRREQLVSRQVPGGPRLYNTGGSSGEPLIFYFDKRRQACDKAARMRTHRWWGIRPGRREAYVWGSPVELSRRDRLRRLRDRLTNELLLSAFELSDRSIAPHVQRLRRFGPDCVFGYPSSIALMCKLARRAGLDLANLPVRVVFSTAEVLHDYQRELISESFGGVPVVNGYGSREGGFIAHECPAGRMHITSEHIIVEFLKDGRPVPDGADGEIVVTHLDNHAMPFIRYRTGDIGQRSSRPCPCGRKLALMEMVKGRTTDFIITPDGRWVHGLALIYVIREIPGIRQYQIVQEQTDSVRVRVVPEATCPPDVDRRIREGLSRQLGPGMRVAVEQAQDIAPDPSGKFRHVISQVARDREALL